MGTHRPAAAAAAAPMCYARHLCTACVEGRVWSPSIAPFACHSPCIPRLLYTASPYALFVCRCVGGGPAASKGFFVQPTVFADVTDEMTIAKVRTHREA